MNSKLTIDSIGWDVLNWGHSLKFLEKSVDLNNTFNFIPSDKILIETDSPFLAPVPKRGKTNEPSYLKYTLEHMAKIKNISPQEMELITSQNFKKLFEVN